VGYNLLKDLPAIQKNILKLLPHRLESEVLDLLAEMDVLIGRYVRGQITVALIVGGLTSVALAALGLPYGILIGALAGLMNLVPIVGYWISLILALLVALSTDDALRMSLSVTAVFFTIQIIEQNLISPRIVGEQTGLHPVAVLLSLLVFASLMGLAGALLAIPIVLFIRVFFRRYLARRLREAAFPPI
jgi:predicted PurR-regulated permease PerM